MSPAPSAVFNMREMRESLALAEQLAKASMSSNKSRAQQLQQLDTNNNNNNDEETPRTYVPPKQLLLYLVRYPKNIENSYLKTKKYCTDKEKKNDKRAMKDVSQTGFTCVRYFHVR